MRQNKLLVAVLFFALFVSFVSAAGYVKTNNIEFNDKDGYSFGDFETNMFDNKMCESGQDFVLQIAPGSCSPAIVRSDLLEEQDVPVFCEIQAIKINPLANIQSIDSMTFRHEGSDAIRTVGFQPAYDALGGSRKLSENMWNNIGSAVFILKQNKNESSMPEIVSGNLSATLRYDMEDGFGLRKNTFYLPLMTDGQFEQRMGQYSFFDKRGYLRAEDIQPDSATFSVYSGRLQNPNQEGSSTKQRVQSYTLEKGKTTPEIFLPGLDCMSAVEFKLESIEFADLRAQVKINSEVIELGEEEKFLGDKCRVVNDGIKKNGLNQQIKISCPGADEDKSTFTLRISPSLRISVDNVVNQYQLGQELFREGKFAYFLGYADYRENEQGESGPLIGSLVAIPIDGIDRSGQLTEEQLNNVANFIEDKSFFGDVASGAYMVGRWLLKGDSIYEISNNWRDVGGRSVSLVGLGSGGNAPFIGENSEVLKKYFDLAEEDLDYVKDNFETEKYPQKSLQTLSEESLFSKMQLVKKLRQKDDFAALCEEFASRYPKSRLEDTDCDNIMYQSNEGISSHEILIDGDYKEISLQRVNIPAYKDFGAEVMIQKDGSSIGPVRFTKNKKYYLSSDKTEWIQLIKVDEEGAEFKVNLDSKYKVSSPGKIAQDLVGALRTLKKEVSADLGSKYTFTLTDTKVSRMAKVSANPVIKYSGSTAEFNYHIGIEKRDIQLSPEMTAKVIDKLNETITTFTEINEKLTSVIKTMEDACLVTGAALNLKALLWDSDEAIAREKVMDYWKSNCSQAVSSGIYGSQNECYLKNSDTIDKEVDTLAEKMNAQDNNLEQLEPGTKTGIFGDRLVDTEALAEKYSKEVAGKLNKFPEENLMNKEKKVINLKEVASWLTVSNFKNGVYDLDELKAIELNLDYYGTTGESRYKEALFNILDQIARNSDHVISANKAAEEGRFDPSRITYLNLGDKVKTTSYTGATLKEIGLVVEGFPETQPVQPVQTNHGIYYVVLEDVGKNEMTISMKDEKFQIYDQEKKLTQSLVTISQLTNFKFVKVDDKTYNNRFIDEKEFVVSYYETEPNKGLPAIVPLDKAHGWYAYIDETVPVFGKVASYEDSGRVSKFDLCNVGLNGLLEANKGMGDDSCQTFSLTTAPVVGFGTLDLTETRRLVNLAVNAIKSASSQHASSISSINIEGVGRTNVGSPLVNLPAGDCTDYMSPKDCNLLFNVCDPVVCPASRCDLGGDYPVQDVVQSGIIGSLVLCLPNANEGIYMPVCLTGVKAGIDGFTSVLGAYQQCLEQNLETGETIGICDEIHSVYLCEFLWKQGLPLAKMAIPKLLKLASGENVRGGGEYSGVEKAWKNAQASVSYFTEFYAVNAFKVFKARGQGEAGSEVCNTFVSTAYPKGQGVFDTLSLSTSPPQFNANFDAIPMTSQTNPPMTHYKVYYHIYAGNDRGAYYKVYLRGSESSYYQDADSGRIVGSGYIPKGETKDISEDFTGPQGYKELCVLVNDQEECGFGSVTTSFSANYVKDQYIKDQAAQSDITTEKGCISGTASAASLLNLNVQAASNDLISPEIYNKGIIRVCATQAPGTAADASVGTTSERWVEVGYCDNKAMKCWVDRDSVDDALKFDKTKEDYLNESTTNLLEKLQESGKYWTDEEFDKFVKNNLTEIETPTEISVKERVGLIDSIFSKVYLNDKKGFLFYNRGKTYADFAEYLFVKYIAPELDKKPKDKDAFDEVYMVKTVEDIVNDPGFVSPYFILKSGSLSTDLAFEFSEGKWKYRVGGNPDNLEKNWIVITKRDQAGTKYRDLFTILKDANFLDGLAGLMQKTVRNDLSNAVSNAELTVRSVANFKQKKIFELIGSGIYFKYDNNEWFWSGEASDFNDLSWMSVKNDTQIHVGKSFWGSLVGSPITMDKYYLSGDALGIANLLQTFDLKEGAALIFGAVDVNQFEVTISWTKDSAVKEIERLSGEYSNNYGTTNEALTLGIIKKVVSELIATGILEYGKEDLYFGPALNTPNFVLMIEDINAEEKVPESVVVKKVASACSSYQTQISMAASANNIPYELLLSVIYQESTCNPNAVSQTGCKGMMQFCSGAAYDYGLCEKENCASSGYDYRFDANKNINAGAKYLNVLINRYVYSDDKVKLALAAYNGGMGLIDNAVENANSDKWTDVSSALTVELFDKFTTYKSWTTAQRESKIREIRDYVEKIMKNTNELKESSVSIDSARKEKFEQLINDAKKLTGSYSNNKYFVKTSYSNGFLTEDQFSEITGNEIVEFEENMAFVTNVLTMNYLIEQKMNYVIGEKRTKKWDFDSAIEVVNQLSGRYDANKLFVDQLYEDGKISVNQYVHVAGAAGISQLDVDLIAEYLKSNKEEMPESTEDTEAPIESETNTEVIITNPNSPSVKLQKANWPVQETLKYVQSLKGSYSADDENKLLVDLLCKDNVFDAAQCKEINGEGFWNIEENMKYVASQLLTIAVTRFQTNIGDIPSTAVFKVDSTTTTPIITTTPETCEAIEVPEEVKVESDAAQKVLKMAEDMVGKSRISGKTSCYLSLEAVYDLAEVDFRKCYYSDTTGKTYPVGPVTQSSDAQKGFYTNPNCQYRDLSENRKLNGIEPGDFLDVVYSATASHNVMFVEWIDNTKKIAKVFDWNGPDGTYGYQEYDLSDDSHPVYMYRKPFLA